jgi:hypothetical protein
MSSIVVKIIDKNKPGLVGEAEGELEGAGFVVVYKDEAEFLGVDAKKHGGGEQTYGPSVIIIGKK